MTPTFNPGDAVEIPAVTGKVMRIDKDGDVWVRLDNGENWVCKPGRLRKINKPRLTIEDEPRWPDEITGNMEKP